MADRSRHLVDVALPLPIHHTFTYAVEAPRPPAPGTRVRVPFRRRERIGWVTGTDAEAVPGLRPVLDVLDETPTVPADIMALARWMAEYYVAPLGLALRAAMPAVHTDVSTDYIALAGTPPSDCTSREARLLGAVGERDGPQRVATLRKALSMGSLWPEIRRLKVRGLLRHETVPPGDPPVRTRRVVTVARWLEDLAGRDELFGRAYRQREAYELLEASGGSVELRHLASRHGFSRSVVRGLEEKGLVELTDEEVLRDPFADQRPERPPDHVLTADQNRCVDALVGSLEEASPRPWLLHGITGSGKTRVYIELLRQVLEEGKGAVVLVPEISLTPQTVRRFRSHFGDEVAVLHSGLSEGERYDAWRQLRTGERRIAVGARSALFAPVEALGAVVVDEEHESTYKQSDAPRYHARDLAVVRASLAGAVCVLGSATPSLETWANSERGKFRRLSLPERVGGGALPPVEVVDLRTRRKGGRGGRTSGGDSGDTGRRTRGDVLSERLVEEVRHCLDRGEQAILLLNRRGYSSFVQCRECGDVRPCRHCSISLTYHRVPGRLMCHHCGYEERAPRRCDRCGSDDLSFRGLGTEQVERVVTESFPRARVARMDVDTTAGKWSHHEILGRVERGEVDILLGTQMIAKGLDFPRVTLVGVVNADTGIHLPDFRASERTFQLLSQVAGRTGRGELGGRVLIQTSLPDHYAIRAAVDHDYTAFVSRELDARVEPAYPPRVRLANVVFSSPDADATAAAAEEGAHWARRRIRRSRDLEVVGPAPSPIERLHRRWRWHFLVRSPSARSLGALCRALVEGVRPRGRDTRMALDRDPTHLL